MHSLAIVLVIISAMMHAVRDFLTKKTKDKQIFVWLFNLAAPLIYLPLFIIIGADAGFPSDPKAWWLLAISGSVHIAYWFCLTKALDHGDLSHVYPISRSAPAIVLLFAVIFLQERVSLLGAAGILIVATGVYCININSFRLGDLLAPITAIRRDKAVRYALATMLCIAAYSLTDKLSMRYFNPLLYCYLLGAIISIFYTPFILLTYNIDDIKKCWFMNMKSIIINGFLVLGGYALILVVFTFERVSYVTGLRQLGIVFAVLLGGHILKEKNKHQRLFAAGMIFSGAFLISIAD